MNTPYRWNGHEFATRREVTDAIAAEVAQWLCAGGAGSVTRGADVFQLEVQIRMSDTDGGENDSRAHVDHGQAVENAVLAKHPDVI